MALKALLFDCDGVLAETEGDGHRVAFNKTFAAEGIDAYWSVEEYGRLLKIGGGKERMLSFFREAPEKYPPQRFTEEYITRLHREKTAIFMELARTLPPRPGVRRLMLEAADAGIQVFICSTSNEKSVAAIVQALLGDDANRVVTAILAGDVVPAKKPAPDVYQLVPRRYGIPAEECLVVEDTRIGLLAATAAGMRCLVTTSTYSKGESFSEAAAVVECLGDETHPASPIKGLPAGMEQVSLETLQGLLLPCTASPGKPL